MKYISSTVSLWLNSDEHFIPKLILFWWTYLFYGSDCWVELELCTPVLGKWQLSHRCFYFNYFEPNDISSLTRHAAPQNQERTGRPGEAEGFWWHPPPYDKVMVLNKYPRPQTPINFVACLMSWSWTWFHPACQWWPYQYPYHLVWMNTVKNKMPETCHLIIV